MTLNELFTQFLYEKKLSGLKDSSINDYIYQLRRFQEYIDFNMPADHLDENMIELYIDELYKSHLKRGTIHSYIRSLRIFLKYASEKTILSINPYKIKVPRMPKKQVKVYTDDEIQIIFKSIKSSKIWLKYRNICIIALMLDSGLRQMEVSNLRMEDIQFPENRMIVHGKGDKDRYVPIGDSVKSLLQGYIISCPFIDNRKTGPVFYSEEGSQLSKNAIKLMFQRLKKNLPFEISSHKLRHNFATNYCLNLLEKHKTIDPLQLKALMGHESIQTTEKYIHTAMSISAAKNYDSHLDKLDINFL